MKVGDGGRVVGSAMICSALAVELDAPLAPGARSTLGLELRAAA